MTKELIIDLCLFSSHVLSLLPIFLSKSCHIKTNAVVHALHSFQAVKPSSTLCALQTTDSDPFYPGFPQNVLLFFPPSTRCIIHKGIAAGEPRFEVDGEVKAAESWVCVQISGSGTWNEGTVKMSWGSGQEQF